MPLSERHSLYVRVEQYELPNVPCKTVSDSGTERFLESVVNEVRVQGMPALGRPWHFDFPCQDRLVGVTVV